MSFYDGKRILVSGATGLIGSHVVEELLNRGAAVSATLHRSPPAIDDPRIDYRRGLDLSRKTDCEDAVRGCDTVILAAANTSGAHAIRNAPVSQVTENLLINAQLLESAWRAGVERILYVSSTTVYPLLDHPRREEEAFLGDPHPVYFGVGWMKRFTEKLCEFYHEKFGLKITLVRPTNVYGPRDKADVERSHVLPALIRRVLGGAEPVEVWGDGTAVRDFLYVSDLVDAMLALLETDRSVGAVNVGTGEAISIREAVDAILRLSGRSGTRVAFDPAKPVTLQRQSVDVSRLRALLDPWPRVPFEEGLRRTIEWYRSCPS